ncbi:tetratricopeptide repeat protein [Hymenobacter edaphi]|uniref:Uncharacterized protein n=1 Tax=Hymenobacter edaphi TaxID=2211146 RepID=A0A328BM62_9BACT|nr:hypothetical protein [Hymenobacter edaphi]RAK67034.1 hypothetical protein DLM85_12605 [Hymenobacter edaphi]
MNRARHWKRRLALAGLWALATTGLAQTRGPGVLINELPRYGGGRKTKALLKLDQAFLADCDQRYPSRDSAARAMLAFGWRYLHQQDYATAMKRFNQAWLLDSTNANVYRGFGVLCGVQQRYDASVYFLERSRQGGVQDAALLGDLGNTLLRRYDQLHIPADLRRSIGYLEEAAAAAGPQSPQAAAAYTNLTLAYYRRQEYARAWEYAEKAEAIDARTLPPGLLSALQQAMPRPIR